MSLAKVGIIGASGFTGKTLAGILLGHKSVELQVLNSESNEGKLVSEIYPEFTGSGLKFTNYSLDEIGKKNLNLVFLAMPDGNAKNIAIELIEKGIKVIDLSKDFRFSEKAVYGLPEFFSEEIKKAKLVANPGCYATACLLASKPLDETGGIKHFIFDCKSGVSGAGKKPSNVNNFNSLSENILAYKLTNHKHLPEIGQFLKGNVSFTPHVIPAIQGIMCTLHVIFEKKVDAKEVKKLYEKFYSEKEFVKILGSSLPELHGVQKSNYCHIGGFEVDESNQMVIVSTIDNLFKGAAGQAIQNMNLMLGFNENEGLLKWKKN